jgi:hypothetical protein
MRACDPPVHYLVGTPKGRLSRLEAELLGLEWQLAREGVEVKLLSRIGELYVLARSRERMVFRVGFFFFVWLRFCQGAVAPSRSPRAAGLQLRILNGVVSLLTTRSKTRPWRICERTDWRERKSSNDNCELTRMFLRGLPRGFSEEVHLGGRLRFS